MNLNHITTVSEANEAMNSLSGKKVKVVVDGKEFAALFATEEYGTRRKEGHHGRHTKEERNSIRKTRPDLSVG